MKCYKFILNRIIIVCKAYKCHIKTFPSFKFIKFFITKWPCDLSSSVWSEIKENNRIFLFYRSNWFPIFYHYSRNHKFICLFLFIRICYRLNSTICRVPFSLYHSSVSSFHTFPTIITIHDIIASHHRCDLTYSYFFHLLCQLFCKTFSWSRSSISSI